MPANKIILGSEEWCSFPDLGIPLIKARVDSGAKTSSLHAINIVPFTKEDDTWVKFDINPIQNNLKTILHCEAKLIGNQSWEIELTLTNRDSMGFRMLLGREAMSGRILVDPEQK